MNQPFFRLLKRAPLAGLFILLFANHLFAQPMEITDATTPPITPENLISNIFLGDGVEVVDVTFEGDPLSVGYFKNGQNAVGIERGIVMTSGRATGINCNVPDQTGANCNGGQFASTDNGSSASDADLSAIAAGGLSVFDVAKFTITFIPTSDTLRFKYVFASEEYPEWACSPFNDVFGFFISGPGLSGPYQNNGTNIALIPGTTTPVSINNIHPANGAGCPPVFSQFYNNNLGTSIQPVYDGYLDVFVAEVVVIPCETYVIKLSLSDVGDPAFDTGVFLEAKSFGTGSLQVETATVSLDGTITEDCATGSITFTHPGPVEDDFLLDYTIIGTAQNGVDYLPIPLDLFIPIGDSSVTIDIVALEDGFDEGMESIGIDIQRDVCNRDTFWIFIRDNEILPPDLGPDATICTGDSVLLDATLPIPLPVPPSFTNGQDFVVSHNGPTYSPIQVAGVQPVTLGPGVIQSVCLNVDHNWVDDVDVFLISPGGQFIELSSDNGSNCDDYNNVCFTPNAVQSIASGFPWQPCTSGVQASFANGTFAPEGVWSDLWDGDYPTNGIWQLLVIDDQMGFNGTLLDWTITFEPLYQVYYEWTPNTGLSCADCPMPTATPSTTTTYTVVASDTYGCTVQDSITITANNTRAAPNINCSDVTNNSITFNWDAVSGAMGYMVSINGGAFVQNNGNSQVLNGLTLDSTVTIEVYAIGNCSGLIGTATCSTPSCNSPSLSITNVTNVTCNGNTDGAVTLQAAGGAGDYTYTFDGVSNTTGVFTGIAEGNYMASVIDSWNCPNVLQVTVAAPQALNSQAFVVNGVSCNGLSDATLAAAVAGGTYPFSFLWNNGLTDSIAINLGAGLQTVIVVDGNGCADTASYNLTEPPLLTLSTAVDSVDCSGTATGGALVLIAGGTADYDVLWDAAAGNANTPLVNNLAAGSYSVTVTDANNCTASATATVLEPSAITASIAQTSNPLCNGTATGTATATASGGTGTLEFFWNNGDYGPLADSLSAGAHFVTVSDQYGCSTVQTFNLNDPSSISIQLTPSDVSCFGGSDGNIVANATGGTSPFNYLWSNGANVPNPGNLTVDNYCLTVTDANGCTATACADVQQPSALSLNSMPTNTGCVGSSTGEIDLSVSGGVGSYQFVWDNSQTTEDLTGLPAGTFSVTVTDGNGCTATLTESIGESTAVLTQLAQTGVKCQGGTDGTISTTVTGGSGTYIFSWSGPNGFTSNLQNPINLPAGNYDLTVTDAIGCTAINAITVTQEDTLAAIFNLDFISCFGENDGRIEILAIGGVPPYRFSIDSGEVFVGNNIFTYLEPGLYDLVVLDDNGCTWEQPQAYLGEPDELTVSLGPDTILPYGTTLQLDPDISNLVNAGTATFDWYSNNPQLPPVDSASRIGEFVVVSPASVIFTVTDENGCTAEDLINIFVQENREVVVPTGFAPGAGGNAVNDLLHVHGNSGMVKEIKLFRVFDRWGELMYEAVNFPINDLNTGWDGTFKGKDMPAGVYVWYVDVEFVDGLFEGYKGETTLVR